MTTAERLAGIIAQHLGREGPLLPICHDVQAEFGCEVHGVVSFYHDFRAKADPRPAVQLCRAEACQARGVEALVAAGERAAGDRVRISTVYCLGLCSVGPAARVGDSLHAKLDEAALVRLIEAV
jgi:formate dehydrogenase subunit gamma